MIACGPPKELSPDSENPATDVTGLLSELNRSSEAEPCDRSSGERGDRNDGQAV